MRIEVVTLFPEMVQTAAHYGVTGRALERRLWTLACRNPRDYASDAYRSVDDRPYGGGPGMVMLAEPLELAIGAARTALGEAGVATPRVVCLSPQGEPLRHARVATLATEEGLILVAGGTRRSTSASSIAKSIWRSPSAISWCQAVSCRRCC